MNPVAQYTFYKTKYGDELLIDVVELDDIKKYIAQQPAHILTYYDITWISEGSGFFYIDQKKYLVKPGDVIFSRPGEVRKWDKDKIINGYALIFEEEFLLSFFNDPEFLHHLSYFHPEASSMISLDSETGGRIPALIKDIKSEIDTYQVKDKHILRALLYETLMLLNRAYIGVNGSNQESLITRNQHVNKFITLVNTDFGRHHSIRYYADKLCITSNYLNEVVKDTMGVSAKQCLQNKIISETKKVLAYTNSSVSEIADSMGFEDLSYFIRFFRKQTGYTPLGYRKTVGQTDW